MTPTPHEVGCPATLHDDDHVHQCARTNFDNITHVDKHSGSHLCIVCDHTWGTLTATEAKDAADGLLPRCPVCQHWPAPHRRNPCAGIVGTDRNGVQVLCGCDGADYGLQARLMFIESDLTQLARAGAWAARGGTKTAEALAALAADAQALTGRLDGLRDAVAGVTDTIADLTTRINALEGRTAHLGHQE